MPKTIKLPDGRTIVAPDDATPEELDAIANEADTESALPAMQPVPSHGPRRPEGAEFLEAMKARSPVYASLLSGLEGGGVASIGIPAQEGARRLVTGLANRLYRGAIKTPQAIAKRAGKTGGSQIIAQTGLEEGIPSTRKGFERAEQLISDLDAQVSGAIAGSQATIPRQAVARRLGGTVQEFRSQVDPLEDLAAIAKTGRGFKRTVPESIPVQQAQRLKQGTYQAIGKKFGQRGAASVEAEKALARGLREEISAAVPEVAPINARQGRLIQLRDALAAAEQRAGNRDAVGLTDIIAAATHPGLLAVTLGSRPGPISRAAIALNRVGRSTVPPEALNAAIRELLLSAQGQ